ncbi:MAG: type II toxin-antitoxin system HicA family toxin [Mariprofundus sp.]|nr:type II toxin-antitoxin system HicA family toxin [Mariprofundus sp.]
MSKLKKALEKLKGQPRDFTWDEAVRVMTSYDFKVITGGRSGGSRRKFVHQTTGVVVSIHKPHPGNELKLYQVEDLLEGLSNAGCKLNG